MFEIEPQDPEEGDPAEGVAFHLVVPIVSAREPAMDDADDTGAAGAGFDRPFGGNAARSFLGLDHEAVRRRPCGDLADQSMLSSGAKWETALPPSRSSTSLGTNHEEMPGPVAMACQTSSGVPGTSTSASTERRPDASFFTGMSHSLLW